MLLAFGQVSLLRSAKFPSAKYGSHWVDYSYSVAVHNLAFDKNVVIWGRGRNGTWSALSAHYVLPMGAGYELWEVHTNEGFDTFAVRYDARRQTYWDNNGGQNYRTVGIGVNLYNQVNILRSYAAFEFGNRVSVGVHLRNIAYAKRVNVVYTTDAWHTSSAEPLQYHSIESYSYGSVPSPNEAGVEYWHGAFGVPAGSHIEYAFSYEVAGQTHWDNNHGANYVCMRESNRLKRVHRG